MKRRLLFPLLVMVCSTPALGQWQNNVQGSNINYGALGSNIIVSVKRMANAYTVLEVRADGFVDATPEQTWSVLTDYDHLSDFIPNLESSKLISRNGQEATVEENGKVGFLFFAQNVRMVVHVTEHPFSALDIVQVSGSMKHYTSRWELAPSEQHNASGTRITYEGMMEPDFFVPPLYGTAMVQADVKKMVAAMIAEISKRNAK